MKGGSRKRFISAILWLSMLTALPEPGSYAENTNGVFTSHAAMDDALHMAEIHSEESSCNTYDSYYSEASVEYVRSLIYPMAPADAYRLSGESSYSESATFENVMPVAETIWANVTGDYYKDPAQFMESQYGSGHVYSSMESANRVCGVLKEILGESGAIFSSDMTPGDVWSAACSLSESSGCGGEFSWDDTTFNGGTRKVETGDQVRFSITAFYGEKKVPVSYTQHTKVYVNDLSYKGTEKWRDGYDEAFPEGGSERESGLTVVYANSVTYEYCGLVLDVDDSGVRAVCGSLDLSGLGRIGSNSAEMDARGITDCSGKPVGTFTGDGSGQGTVSDNGKGKTDFSIEGGSPPWGISIDTAFCHNNLDYDGIVRKLYGETVSEGDQTGAHTAGNEGNRSVDAAAPDLGISKKNIGYLQGYNTARLNMTVAESVAWIDIFIDRCGGNVTAETMAAALPESRRTELQDWLANSGKTLGIAEIAGYINDSICNDRGLAAKISDTAMFSGDNPSVQVAENIENILTYFFLDTGYNEGYPQGLRDGLIFDASSNERYLLDYTRKWIVD